MTMLMLIKLVIYYYLLFLIKIILKNVYSVLTHAQISVLKGIVICKIY